MRDWSRVVNVLTNRGVLMSQSGRIKCLAPMVLPYGLPCGRTITRLHSATRGTSSHSLVSGLVVVFRSRASARSNTSGRSKRQARVRLSDRHLQLALVSRGIQCTSSRLIFCLDPHVCIIVVVILSFCSDVMTWPLLHLPIAYRFELQTFLHSVPCLNLAPFACHID